MIANPLEQHSILLSRTGVFHELFITWDPVEEDPNDCFDRAPLKRSAKVSTARIGDMSDEKLAWFIAERPEIPKQIFGSLMRILAASNGEMANILSHSKKMAVDIERIQRMLW